MNWKELNEKYQRVNEKLNQPLLSELKELIINQSLSEDVLEKKLLEFKVNIIFLLKFEYLILTASMFLKNYIITIIIFLLIIHTFFFV